MLLDGMQIMEGSTVSNLITPSGVSFPENPNVGELFYKTSATIGMYFYDGTDWAVVGSGSGGSSTLTATQIGFGSGSNQLTGSTKLMWNDTTNYLTIGDGTGSGNIIGSSADASNSAGSVRIYGGSGGSIEASKNGADLRLSGGSASTTGNATGGNVSIQGGRGTGTGTAGFISFETGGSVSGSTIGTERLRITKDGAWSVGSGGTSYGSSGQVLTSNGNAPPSWQAAGGGTGVTTATANTIAQRDATADLYANAFYSNSDLTLKDNVVRIFGAVQVLSQFDGVEFTFKATGKKSSGVIAQQVEEVLPHLVNTNEQTGLKAVDYAAFTGYLIEAIKELRDEIEQLKRRLVK